MNNYVSIREILEKEDFYLLQLMIGNKISTKMFHTYYKKSYNKLLRTENKDKVRLIYLDLGLKPNFNEKGGQFLKLIRFDFLEEIPCLKCYELYFKEVGKKEKGEKEGIYESIFEHFPQNFSCFEYLNFLRLFFVHCHSKSIKEGAFIKIGHRLIREMQEKLKEPFLQYLFCTIGLQMMYFSPYVFKKHFLIKFFWNVIHMFNSTKDQKFMAVISDIINCYKDLFTPEDKDLSTLVSKTSKVIVHFFSESTKNDKFAKCYYKSSDFLTNLSQSKKLGKSFIRMLHQLYLQQGQTKIRVVI